jgi:hypothetical protein
LLCLYNICCVFFVFNGMCWEVFVHLFNLILAEWLTITIWENVN